MAFLLIATLLSAALIAFGAVGLVLRRPEPARPAAGSDGGERAVRQTAANDDAANKQTVEPTPVARLKAVVRARDWRRALPSLLVIAGLLGVMLFGSLALLFVFGHVAAGIASLAVTVFAVTRLALDYARA